MRKLTLYISSDGTVQAVEIEEGNAETGLHLFGCHRWDVEWFHVYKTGKAATSMIVIKNFVQDPVRYVNDLAMSLKFARIFL